MTRDFLVLTCLLALVVVAVAGTHSRFVADDFGSAASVRDAGIISSQISRYNSWSGRYSASLLINISELAGPRIPSVIPVLSILVLLLSTFLLIRRLLRHLVPGSQIDHSAAAISIASSYSLVVHSGPVFQTWLWLTGNLTYVTPIVLTVLLCILISSLSEYRLVVVIVPLAAFVTAGFNETWTTMQFTAATLLVFVTFAQRRSRTLSALYLSGTILGFSLMALAPGNHERAAHFEQPAIGRGILNATFDGTSYLWYQMTSSEGLWVVCSVSMLFALGLPIRRTPPSRVILGTLAGWAILVSGFAPAEVSMGQPPPGRAMTGPHLLVILFAVVVGFQFSAILRSAPRRTGWLLGLLAILLATLTTIESVRGQFHLLERVSHFSEHWDRVDIELKRHSAEGNQHVLVNAPGGIDGLPFLTTQRDHWTNRGMAGWYRLGSVRRNPVSYQSTVR